MGARDGAVGCAAVLLWGFCPALRWSCLLDIWSYPWRISVGIGEGRWFEAADEPTDDLELGIGLVPPENDPGEEARDLGREDSRVETIGVVDG